MSRRVILTYTTGIYAGLRQVHGTDDEVPSLPSRVDSVAFRDGRIGSATLAGVHERYVEYREIIREENHAESS